MIEIGITVIVLLLLLNLFMIYRMKSHGSGTTESMENFDREIGRIESSVKGEISRNRDELSKNLKDSREEISNSFRNFNESTLNRLQEASTLQKNQIDSFATQFMSFTRAQEDKFDKLSKSVEDKLRTLQEDNNSKLEKMRETVDEKLHSTLEKRLGESFKLVSERLELVHKGLGEMQSIASGVGDLKKVLSNVKTRGVFGEGQLANLLDDILTVDQYSRNVKTKIGSDDTVEFAIKLPGRGKDDKIVWLPVDAKFPIEDYQRLESAYEAGDRKLIDEYRKQLVNRIRACAKYISEKYLDPPNTTDFGILFLPFESLHSEVLRIVGLIQQIQREYKVVITGPTNLSSFLNALQMGFRTLAIERRSSEVWTLLGAVKTDFANFGDILDRTKKKLEAASMEIDSAGAKSRAIVRKLRDVQELPKKEALDLLADGTSKEFQKDEAQQDIEFHDEDSKE